MKRTYYNATIVFKETFNGIYKRTYENYKKIKYKMKGDNVKIYLYSIAGTIETQEYTNVQSISVIKYRA